jgi:hypothetical protein
MWEEYLDEFKKWTEFLGDTTVDDLVKKAEKIHNELMISYPDMDNEEEIKETVITSLVAEIKTEITEPTQGTKVILNMIEIPRSPFNWASKLMEECKRQWNINQEKAIENKYVQAKMNEVGEYYDIKYCDYRKNKKDGTENKNIGKPFENTYIWSVGGIYMTRENYDKNLMDTISRCRITISGELANPSSKKYLHIKPNQWVETVVKIQRDKNDKMKIEDGIALFDANRHTSFDTPFDGFDLDDKDIPIVWYSDDLITLDNLDDKFEKMALTHDSHWEGEHSQGSRKLFVSKLFIKKKIETKNSHIVKVDSKERGIFNPDGTAVESITAWWNNNIPIDFEEKTIGYLYYNMSRNEEKNEEGEYLDQWGDITFNTLGFIPVIKKTKDHEPAKEVFKEITGETDIEKRLRKY